MSTETKVVHAVEKGEEIDAVLLDGHASVTALKKEFDRTQSSLTDAEGYIVPENFALVRNNIYRSSFPRKENFEFLKTKNLRSILVLVSDPYPEEHRKFLRENNIQFFQVGMPANKEPFVNVNDATVTTALKIILNPANQPVMVHCNRGKHRTGCVMGCLRKLMDWSLTMIFDEYRRFAFPKVRPLDQQFIELYDEREILLMSRIYGWIPPAKLHSELLQDEDSYSEPFATGDSTYGSVSIEPHKIQRCYPLVVNLD
ncbi:tyrosine phosphatase family-domain-containing protein [Lipomyces japonicus]|uniref:tyrosine phosphatase family-domain-containing protein n=1 Tax=Lipomyces japonicus TaxID=56871 RepID=UPI0034CD10D8